MSESSKLFITALFSLFVLLVVSCSSPTADTPQAEMIQPGEKIGETVIRKIEDDNEILPAMFRR